jgi:hypothetical protein
MPMNMQIAPICEGDLEEACRFLCTAFGVGSDWPLFQPEVLRWKALTPHPLWVGGRGYALRRNGEIAAYGCAMPTRFGLDGGELLAACVIDWAASKAMPGGGVAIYNHIAKFTDALIGVGGSDSAHRVLRRMSFQARQEFEIYGRVTRPVRRLLGVQGKSWRDVARFGRNVWRGLRPMGGRAGEWRARRVEQFDESLEAVLPRPGLISGIVCQRSAALLNYMLACPAARMEGYLVEREGQVAGYFLLAFTQKECRVAELWVASGDERDWLAALLAAVKGREGNQVSVGCGNAFALQIAHWAGFHRITRQPVYVKDPSGALPSAMDAAMSLLDTDAFLL